MMLVTGLPLCVLVVHIREVDDLNTERKLVRFEVCMC